MIITANISDYSDISFQDGALLLVDKPLDWTSFDIVNKARNILRKHLQVKKIKVGHAGTLDPKATGLVILAFGKFTKQLDAYQAEKKEYIADICFGKTTPSYDSETVAEANEDYSTEHINTEVIRECLDTYFTGDIMQTPPAYSAKSKNGVRAYKMARKGEDIELPPQQIHIYNTEILSFNESLLRLKVECSKGTYIRSLAHDLGRKLNSGAYLSGLRRTKSGDFTVEESMSIEEFEKNINKVKQL